MYHMERWITDRERNGVVFVARWLVVCIVILSARQQFFKVLARFILLTLETGLRLEVVTFNF